MAQKFFFTFFLAIGIYNAFAFADPDYSVSKIPEALLKNANVVKRMEVCRFEVLALGKSRYYHKYALTILNENGDRFAGEVLRYDKLREIKSFEGKLFDANGKEIKRLKKSEIKDLSGVDNISLMDDNRIKRHNFFHRIYPYTIEYETEEQYNYNMFFPTWSPYDGENMAVEQSTISVIAPSAFLIRYKAFNYKDEPVISNNKGETEYKWEFRNGNVIETEVASPNWTELAPVIYVGPTKFEVEKYQGDMTTWNSYGKFFYELNKGRDVLPETIRQKVHTLTDGISDPYKKIEVLYEFLQKNTRYISVQLGIGGWQSYDATYVGSKNYGDCKALSNYMLSLLKEAGIKSKWTLIRNSENVVNRLNDFPSFQFNHAILCVPLVNDTVWLECTSQTLPAGYLGGNNANRQVLLIDENGGYTAQTPKYGANENTQIRKVNATVNEAGLLTASINTQYKAVQQDELHGMINYLSKEKQLEHLKKSIDLPHYDITKFSYKEIKQRLPILQEQLELTANNYASVTGKRLFIIPNVISRSYRKLKLADQRKYPIVMQFEYYDSDSATIEIPAGYELEAKPEPVELKSAFGNYKSRVEVKERQIIYFREMAKFSGEFPASSYADLVKFYDQIYKADRNRVVLVKKE